MLGIVAPHKNIRIRSQGILNQGTHHDAPIFARNTHGLYVPDVRNGHVHTGSHTHPGIIGTWRHAVRDDAGRASRVLVD